MGYRATRNSKGGQTRQSMNNPPFKLFKYPSRGRPDNFFKSLDSIYNNVSDKDYFHVSCTLDSDDETMNNEAVIEKINSYFNISIEWGLSESKIHAINRSMPKNLDWDVIFCMSDDMVFNIFGFDVMVGIDMMNHFPEGDGILHYPDQDARQALATMYIAGKKYYDTFGYIYHPSYKSVWCDNEAQDVAKALNKYFYCGYQINLHMNPAYGHRERDEMFNRQQGDWPHDEANYLKRKANNFDLVAPEDRKFLEDYFRKANT